MRSFVRRGFILGTCLAAAVVWSGCEAKQATEYVSGISTQVKVPRDLKAVRVEVSVGGVYQLCRGYKVYDGRVQLPRSLGAFAGSDSAIRSGPITFTIAGVTTEDLDSRFFAECTQARVRSDSVRILRRSRQPYIEDEILFLPMPLKFACYDKVCDGEDQTCKAGKCVSARELDDNATVTDALKKFPRYSPDLVDGTGSTCFDAELCLAAARIQNSAGAQLVEAANCTYAVPNTASAPPVVPFDPELVKDKEGRPIPPPFVPKPKPEQGNYEGVNVEIAYDGGLVREILDADKDEGFFLPDPANPQRFRLAEGLCEMVKGVDAQGNPTAHRITDVRASGSCRPKSPTQPLCAKSMLKQMGADENGVAAAQPDVCTTFELKPPRAALMVVVDNTAAHGSFYDPQELAAIEFPLENPGFTQTDIGLIYAPQAGDACNPAAPPVINFGRAADVKDPILGNFKSFGDAKTKLSPGIPSLQGALSSAYTALRAKNDVSLRSVLVIGNRNLNSVGCPGIAQTPEQLAAAAKADPQKPILTHAIQLVSVVGDPPGTPVDEGLVPLATAGGSVTITDNPGDPNDGRNKLNAKAFFQKLVNSITTCVYDVDEGTLTDKDRVGFADPFGVDPSTVADFKAECSSEGLGADGWGFAGASPAPGKRRIHLCKNTCDKYRAILEKGATFSFAYQQEQIAVPVFAYSATCPAEPADPNP